MLLLFVVSLLSLFGLVVGGYCLRKSDYRGPTHTVSGWIPYVRD